MTSWTTEELSRIADSDELQISTPKNDATMRRPVPVWVVRHGDALYVRSVRGEDGAWYRGARDHGRGHISVGAIDTDVSFVPITDRDVNAGIDAAYRDKYARYEPRFLDPMIVPRAQATTLELVPARKGT
jgi:hypothetical protein